MRHFKLNLIAVAGVSFLVGCGGPAVKRTVPAEESAWLEEKVSAEAISYNARLYDDGKPASFKLETYLLSDRIGYSGRGYLGKGALKGWIDSDSIIIYLPSVNEFLAEPIDRIIVASKCGVDLSDLELTSLLRAVPEPTTVVSDVTMKLLKEEEDRRHYVLTLAGCEWALNLHYQKTERGWRVWELEFNDGGRYRLRLREDRYKSAAEVSRSRFTPVIPAGAFRITP